MLPQNNNLSSRRRRQLRNRRIGLLLFVAVFLSLIYYNLKLRSEIAVNGNNGLYSGARENVSNHYTYLVLIASTATEFTRRNLIRETYFGLKDNIEPCMQYDTDTYYKFWVYGDPIPRKTVERRQYEAEKMEWDDIVEVSWSDGVHFEQSSILDWVKYSTSLFVALCNSPYLSSDTYTLSFMLSLSPDRLWGLNCKTV